MASDSKKSSLDPGEGTACVTPTYQPNRQEKQAPCQAGCPNCGDIRSWIGLVAQRGKIGISESEAYTRAWKTITDVNPFPSALGRICPHPCEDHCNRSGLDEPLAINAMERFLGDWAINKGLPLDRLSEDSREEWVGVVGAGPSGLSFAYQMARRGYRVTVYESKVKAGGMLRYGVPDYRLPPATLDAEIARILELGVELRLSTAVGRDITLQELRDRHATLYLGLGAQQGRGLGIPGEDGPSVWTGVDYLEQVNKGKSIDLGSAVVVVGGGNTAIDAARTARRTGAYVTILYRRSRVEMPAISEEIDDALEEGIELVELAAPVRLDRYEDGRPRELVACRVTLGEPDSSGRRRPELLADTEFGISLDSLITSISQSPLLKGFEELAHDGNWLVTDSQGMLDGDILAGGDTLRLGIAGNAIVQGRNAAEALHARLRGTPEPQPETESPTIGQEQVNFEHKPKTPATRSDKLPGSERIASGTAEVATTISEQQFLQEVERCFSCGSCMGCEHCAMFCTSACYMKLEEVGPGMYFALTLDGCKECGKCIEVCPSGFLDMA